LNPDLSKYTEGIRNIKVTDLIQFKFLMTDVPMNYIKKVSSKLTEHSFVSIKTNIRLIILKEMMTFNVHGSVHHINVLFHIISTRYTIHRVYFYLILLYMFRALLSPIVRSTKQL
jgi:hypothetical protein